jgi:hypothetical protein
MVKGCIMYKSRAIRIVLSLSLMLIFVACGSQNPILGKWQDSSGIITVEFKSNEMRIGPAVTKVRYQVKGNDVTVYPEGSSSGFVVTKVNSDEISLTGGLGLPGGNLKRVP